MALTPQQLVRAEILALRGYPVADAAADEVQGKVELLGQGGEGSQGASGSGGELRVQLIDKVSLAHDRPVSHYNALA